MNESRDNELAAITRFNELKILVFGDVMLDVYDFCCTSESKPIPSEKKDKRAYKARSSIRVLGGAGNVATNLAALGVTTSLIGVTGNDGNYFTVRELADAQKISHFLVRDVSRPTTAKIRLYIDDEYLLRRDDEATHKVDPETSGTLVSEFMRELHGVDAVILSDYNKGVFTPENAQRLITACHERAIPVVVDFKPPNRAYFCGADIVSPNHSEAAALVPDFGQDLEADIRKLHDLLASRNTVVTLGRNGICCFDGTTFSQIPGNTVKEVDAVGCGDTVRAALTLGHVLGLSLAEAAALANDAAAVIVQKPATAVITPEELIHFIQAK